MAVALQYSSSSQRVMFSDADSESATEAVTESRLLLEKIARYSKVPSISQSIFKAVNLLDRALTSGEGVRPVPGF